MSILPPGQTDLSSGPLGTYLEALFGFQNPYNNPEYKPQFAGRPMQQIPFRGPAYLGQGTAAPRGEFATAIDPKTGQPISAGTDQYGSLQPENVSENYKDGKYEGPMPGSPGGPTISQEQNEQGGNKEDVDAYSDKFFDLFRELNDPEALKRKLEATEDYFLRVAQRNQKMGLENLEAAGQAAFKYKYAPQMAMTAAASKAAYYPEMVRAASDSFTGLNLAAAAKPRMSGYYRGLI